MNGPQQSQAAGRDLVHRKATSNCEVRAAALPAQLALAAAGRPATFAAAPLAGLCLLLAGAVLLLRLSRPVLRTVRPVRLPARPAGALLLALAVSAPGAAGAGRRRWSRRQR